MLETLTTKIHSGIADGGMWSTKNDKGQVAGQDAAKLWYYIRAMDLKGSGKVTLDLAQASEILDRSPQTIRRWTESGKRLNFFRSINRVGSDEFEIYYTSLAQVCLTHGITDLGAVAYVEVHELKNLKFKATEAEAQRLQDQSFYRARREHPNRKILFPEQFMSTSESATGVILRLGGRYVFLYAFAISYGGSQKKIAENLGRHESTVQRRLDHSYRDGHDVPRVDKRQVAKTEPGYSEEFQEAYHTHGDTNCFRPSWSYAGLTYKPSCNIYALDIQLTSAKAQRERVRRFIRKFNQ